MTTKFIDHLLEGDHASRPAFGDVPEGTLYACTTHALIYQSDGVAAWSTWWTGSGVSDIIDIPTAETDTTKVLAPDGAGGVEFRAEAGGGGGGLTQSYVGYNTVGASTEAMTNNRQTMKKITLASAAQVLSIDVHAKGDNTSVPYINGVICDDNSNTIGNVLAFYAPPPDAIFLNTTFRWISIPICVYLAAGTYWIGIMSDSILSVHYDTGGSDRYMGNGGNWLADGTQYGQTDSTRNYSIRASVLS